MKTIALSDESMKDILTDLLKRSPGQYSEYENTVNSIISDVRQNGDKAVFKYTQKFDKWDIAPGNVKVTPEEIEQAYESYDKDLIEVMEKAAENIRDYHSKQLTNSWIDTKEDGTILGQKITAISTVGVYVPGGKAAYPSTLLMNIVPALCAGVPEILICTPAGADGKVTPVVLAAAKITGIKKIFKTGGAQAIAAMAYGTESIPKTDKIVGPGNIYVALAKKAVYGHVSIDSVAGPSEVMVLADETANPRYVAADLLSQAEHDEMSSAILVTASKELADKVSHEIESFLQSLSRREIIEKSLNNYGYILVADNMEDAVEAVNDIASEHLEIVTKNPFETMTKIKNAGAIFLGEYSSEPLGDYFAGPNHVLPTGGTARYYSVLNVETFMKRTSIISYTQPALAAVSEDIIRLAETEGLDAHANAIRLRK